jgi:hypothetical protein
LTITASTPLLFGYIDYFSPINLAYGKSCPTILPTHPTIHLQNRTRNEGAKMQQKGSKFKHIGLEHTGLDHGLIEPDTTFHM